MTQARPQGDPLCIISVWPFRAAAGTGKPDFLFVVRGKALDCAQVAAA